MARKRKKLEDAELEADLIPIMNIMLLLIPALLLAMEVAQFAAVPVMPPKYSATAEKKEEKPDEPPLDLRVFVANDGFRITAQDQQDGAEAGQETDSAAPTIPVKNSNADDFERYDYAALEAKAKEYKRMHADEVIVKIDAEQDIPFQVLAFTMDALRGSDCKMKTVLQGETMEACLFWQPIIDPRHGGA